MTTKKMIPAEEAFRDWRRAPAYVAAYDSLEEEFALASAMIRARAHAGLTQEELARRMHTTQAVIARLESGRVKPSTRTLERLAAATGMRLRILFEPAPAPATPPLAGEATAEIAVVGGGFTGLSAALHLAEAGIDTVLVEAGEPGWGASGRNGGQVIPGLKHTRAELVDRLGVDFGRRLGLFAERTADIVFELVERHGIACDAVRSGWIRAAHSKEALAALAYQVTDANRHGVEVELLDRATIAAATGTDLYLGGMLDRRGGTLQPLSYARGLARAALKAGARLHGASRAIRIEAAAEGAWRVATEGGAVTARRVLLATNAYTDDLWPGLKRTVIPVFSAQVATVPLGDNVRRTILPAGQGVSDTRRLLLYFRLDPAGRLVFGGRGSVIEGRMARSYRFVERAMRRAFPLAADAPREFAWSGQVALTKDVLPHVNSLAPGIVAALGYNGRGVAMATAMGALMARYLASGDPSVVPFPIGEPRPIPYHRLRLPGIAATSALYRLRDRLGL